MRFGTIFAVWISGAAALLACAPQTPPPAAVPAEQPQPPRAAVIPWPAHVTAAAGTLQVRDGTPIVYDASDSETPRIARYLADLVKRCGGPLLNPEAANMAHPPSGAIVLRRIADVTGAEGYRIEVTPDGIVIAAGEGAGLFYGAVTAWQLLTATPSHAVTVPAMHIEDAPRFHWRGLLLDSARHYQSPAFVKAFIEQMALHKLNVLQWHLTDDQGWRLEIRRYPRLTRIGAWRIPAGAVGTDPKTGKHRRYGGYYTQSEVREIVRFAAERHVTIVPEIEMPGHATAAIVAYPKLGSTRHPPKAVSASWGVFDNLYNVDDETFRFLENVLTETMALFPGEYIHVGGDEAVKDQWKASPRIQAQMKKLGLANEDALQAYFIARIGKFLNAHGRKLIGWDEILAGGVPPDATITSWRGVDGAITAAKSDHDTVLSPAPDLYFDNWQGTGPDQPPGRAHLLSLEDVYNFDAAPDHLSEAERAHIIGVQANIWTEHIRTESCVDLMAFPRAAALAEVAWSGWRDWPGFLERLGPQMARYRALGIAASDTQFEVPRPLSPTHRFSQELELCSRNIALNLEDDWPPKGPRAIFLTDIMNPCWIWRGADLSNLGSIQAGVGQVPFNFEVGDDRNKIVLRPPATPYGELEVHQDACDGPNIAVLSLKPAVSDPGVTEIAAPLTAVSGSHDLCFVFTQKKLDPLWLLDWVQLVPKAH